VLDALECSQCVLDALEEADYRRIRRYEGRSSLGTFLHAVINRLAITCKREKYGRRRVPETITRLGPWAEKAYVLICWDNYSPDDAYDYLTIAGLYQETRARFLQDCGPILNKARSPDYRRPVSLSVDAPTGNPLEGLGAMEHDTRNPSHILSKEHSEHLRSPLEQLLGRLEAEEEFAALGVIREMTAGLPEDEQLLVRLVYGENHSVAAAAKGVGLKPKTAQRRLKRLLTRFREALLKKGIRRS